MTKKQKEIEQMALRLSNMDVLYCNIMVNRRNGFYAVDKYSKENGKYIGVCFIGNWMETKCFLQGMLETVWSSKPF